MLAAIRLCPLLLASLQLHRHHRQRDLDGDRGSDHNHVECAGQRRLWRQRNLDGHGDLGLGRAGRKCHLLEWNHLLGTGTLNSSGVATLSTTTLPAGVDSITATYGAGGNFAASTSTSEPITIAAPPGATPGSYTLAANPTSLTIKMGTTANTTLTFTPTGGYSGTIALSCPTCPAMPVARLRRFGHAEW